MEVFKKIGSKDRLFELMHGVNKLKLNEEMGEQSEFIGKAFNGLVGGELDIEQTNNQVNGDTSIVQITGIDSNGGSHNFTFEVQTNETTQEDVNVINDAKLIKYNTQFPDGGGLDADENSKEIIELNTGRKQEMIDAISEYVEFDDDTAIADEMYEEAIKFIDNVPYNKGSEEMQTHKAYADQKPVNPDVRVDADELQKFVSEIQDYVPDDEEEDMFAMPPDYSPEDMPKPQDTDDGSVSTDPYEQEPQYDDSEASPEEQQHYSQAYDNLIATGNQTPTGDQIEREVLKLKGLNKPVEKTRTIPKGAEEFWEGQTMDDISTDTVVKQGFDKLLPEEKKKQYIFRAQEFVDEAIGDMKMSRDEYVKNIQKEAIRLYKEDVIDLNEEEKGEYPDPIGKKFKPKSQIPKKKRKPQSVVNIKEEDKLSHGGGEYDEENGKCRDCGFYGQNNKFQNDSGGEDCPKCGSRNIYTPDALGEENAPEQDIEQLATDREEAGDQLEGGLGDDKLPNQFDPEQVSRGVKVEMEHTDNPLLAIEIALDHLTEDPNYYGGAGEDPEDMAQAHASAEAEEQSDEETTDELLGFKPHNVSDYANEEFDVPSSPEQERNYWDKEDMRQNPEEYGEEPQEPEDSEDASQKEELYEDVELARHVLKKRRLNEGMTKEQAVQLLIRHNIR